MENKIDTAFYNKYKDLVVHVCKQFKKQIPSEQLDDLTQICWEKIIRHYKLFDSSKAQPSTWIVMMCKSALSNVIRDLNRQKRAVLLNSISLDGLTNGHDKYL